MFRPLGSFTPTAVLTDICLFFDKDQLHQFSLASPRTNGLFKSHRMMDIKTVEICALEKNKLSIVLRDSNIDDTNRKIHIDTNKEDITEKISIILSTCRAIDSIHWDGSCNSIDDPKWEYSIINEQLMELILKIRIKNMYLHDCSISMSLLLFLKFLHRHGNILTLCNVKLPSELVSNKTLSLISDFHILPMEGTDLVVDVTDELLEGNNTQFDINGFITKFTIKGISAFILKDGYRSTSFGTLAFDQMQDAIDFERNHSHEWNKIYLMSTDGQTHLEFYVIIRRKYIMFWIDLKTTDTDQSGMVLIPNNLFGIVEKESFLKFNKICSNPEELLPISQYQMEYLSIAYVYCVLNIHYIIRGENRKIIIETTDVTLKDTHKIIVEILRNCNSINRLKISRIKLDEDFYHLLKPIADNIHVPEWHIESTLEPESIREVRAANSLLFAKINLIFPERICACEKNQYGSIEYIHIDNTKRQIYIHKNKEDLTEKISIFLSTMEVSFFHIPNVSVSFDQWVVLARLFLLDDSKRECSIINEKLMELMLKIKIKNMNLELCSISVPLPLFLKFLYRHGNILSLIDVRLPSELVSNKTLKLISDFRILPMEGTNLVVDVNDEFLEGYNASFNIKGFITKFTIKGISSFTQKDGYRYTSFGILASDQMQDALDFERDHHECNIIELLSTDGQKHLKFDVSIGRADVIFSIDLETTDTDQSGMVPIPNNLFGIVAQESFVKFNKIVCNPEESFPTSQYQMESLGIAYVDCVLYIYYTLRGEYRRINIEKTDVTLKDTQKIIVEILRNCIFIEEFKLDEINLNEDFYQLLKPIADNIHVPEWRIESTLEPESLREVQAANSGLFARINLIFPERIKDEDEGLLR